MLGRILDLSTSVLQVRPFFSRVSNFVLLREMEMKFFEALRFHDVLVSNIGGWYI